MLRQVSIDSQYISTLYAPYFCPIITPNPAVPTDMRLVSFVSTTKPIKKEPYFPKSEKI